MIKTKAKDFTLIEMIVVIKRVACNIIYRVLCKGDAI